MHHIVEAPKPNPTSGHPISRRALLEGSASAGFVAAAAGGGSVLRTGDANAADPGAGGPGARQMAAFRIRQAAAQAYLNVQEPLHRSNGDEARYPDKRASFAKTLPHNEAGEVDPEAFAAFVSVLSSGDPNGFETIPRDGNAETDLNNPQATYAFDLVGLDSAATSLDPPPTFSSALMATEMAEVYWLALTRDVPFRDYETDALVAAAVADMNAFTEPLTSGTGTKWTPATVFRGETRGDIIGPHLSQFLWLDIPYGIKTIEQRYTVPSRGQSFLTNYAEWLACQRGARPGSRLAFDATPRFICSARELAEYVHRDFSFQSYMNAALIMLALGKDALSPTNPYRSSPTQFGDITLGSKNVLSLVAQAALLGQKGAYFHKWQIHRRLRPECFAGRIETHTTGRRQYDLHADILPVRCGRTGAVTVWDTPPARRLPRGMSHAPILPLGPCLQCRRLHHDPQGLFRRGLPPSASG